MWNIKFDKCNFTQYYIKYSKNVKFIYSKKATKFCKIFTLLLTVCTVAKSKVKISQKFVAFSEYMNFKAVIFLVNCKCILPCNVFLKLLHGSEMQRYQLSNSSTKFEKQNHRQGENVLRTIYHFVELNFNFQYNFKIAKSFTTK